MFRPGAVALLFDMVMFGVVGVISPMAAHDEGSWIFGVALAVAALPVSICGSRAAFAMTFGLSCSDQSELRLLFKQALLILGSGILVAAVRYFVEPTQPGVTDPLNLAVLVIITVPLVQNAVKSRHVFTVAVHSRRPFRRLRTIGALRKRARAVVCVW